MVYIPIIKYKKRFGRLRKISRAVFRRPIIMLLALALNGFSFYWMAGTNSFFNDKETSENNLFITGILDFELDSDSDFQPICTGEGEKSEREIAITNRGNPFWYTIYAEDFSSDICDYFHLDANLDGGEVEYSGKLTEFAYGPIVFADPEIWKLTLDLDPGVPEELRGETCDFRLVIAGSQTRNNLPFGAGFSDREWINSSIATGICEKRETRTIGYWKNHSEVFAPHLPVELGNETISSIEEALEIFKGANAKDMEDMLKAQLLGLIFNVEHFDIGGYMHEGQTLEEIIEAANEMLKADPKPSKDELEETKDLIDEINNLHEINFCWCSDDGYEPKEIDEPEPADNRKPKKDKDPQPGTDPAPAITEPEITNPSSDASGMPPTREEPALPSAEPETQTDSPEITPEPAAEPVPEPDNPPAENETPAEEPTDENPVTP